MMQSPMTRMCIEMQQNAPILYESGRCSDCSFLLGAEPKTDVIHAHKLILAMASPVFENLLLRENASTNFPIPVVDVQPKIFRMLMAYIYTSAFNIGSIDDACQLSYTAKKYEMDCLMKKCIDYLWNHANSENVCQIFELTQLVNEKKLMQKCLKIFSTETKRVLNSNSFINAELDTVKRIFSMNNLNVHSELDFVVAAERYLKSRRKVNTVQNNENRIAIVNSRAIDEEADQETRTVTLQQLRDVLQNVRFLTVTPVEFVECPALNSVLDLEDRLALLVNIISDRASFPMASGFTTSRVPRNLTTEYPSNDLESRSEATLRFKIQKFANLTDVVYSPPCYVRRLPWQIMAGPRVTNTEQGPQKSFCFVILCNVMSMNSDWSCNATIELKLVPPTFGMPAVSKTFTRTFNRGENRGGFPDYMEWSEVINPEADYTSARGAVDLEVHIKADPEHRA